MEVDVHLQYTTEDAGNVSSTNVIGGSKSVFDQDPIQFWEEEGQMKQDEELITKGQWLNEWREAMFMYFF